MQSVQLWLWYLDIAARVLLLWQLLTLRRWRQWPQFTAWIGATLACSLALIPLRNTYAAYRIGWEIAQIIGLTLLAAVAAELHAAIAGSANRWWFLLILIPGAVLALVEINPHWPQYPVLDLMLIERAVVSFVVAIASAWLVTWYRPPASLRIHALILMACTAVTAVCYWAESQQTLRYVTGALDAAGSALCYLAWVWWSWREAGRSGTPLPPHPQR